MTHARSRRLLRALSATVLLASSGAMAGTLNPGTLDTSELAGATIPAVPPETVHATVHAASATGFRPAPVPDETLVQPDVPRTDGDTAGTLHPELLSPGEIGSGGAMATASSEYDHNARFRPAGGMGVTIPMQ